MADVPPEWTHRKRSAEGWPEKYRITTSEKKEAKTSPRG
jgi:hypothetical protein